MTFEKFVEIFSNHLEMEFGGASNAVLLLHESKAECLESEPHDPDHGDHETIPPGLFLSKIEIAHRWDCGSR